MGYAGAKGRIDIMKALSLNPKKYRVQEKKDGMYVSVLTNKKGEIKQILSRTGRSLDHDFRGVKIFNGQAEFHGELEGHTERGNQDAIERGYALIHLFDITMDAPYRDRLDALHRGQAEIANPDNIKWFGERNPNAKVRRDLRGCLRDVNNNKFVSNVPMDFRRFPIVQTSGIQTVSDLWDQAQADQIEGAVICNMDAMMGQRGGKRKLKPEDNMDCLVLSAGTKTALVKTFGCEFLVSCIGKKLIPNDVVEVRYNGWYKSGQPRFPRIVRKRFDKCQTTDHPEPSRFTTMAEGQGS